MRRFIAGVRVENSRYEILVQMKFIASHILHLPIFGNKRPMNSAPGSRHTVTGVVASSGYSMMGSDLRRVRGPVSFAY